MFELQTNCKYRTFCEASIMSLMFQNCQNETCYWVLFVWQAAFILVSFYMRAAGYMAEFIDFSLYLCDSLFFRCLPLSFSSSAYCLFRRKVLVLLSLGAGVFWSVFGSSVSSLDLFSSFLHIFICVWFSINYTDTLLLSIGNLCLPVSQLICCILMLSCMSYVYIYIESIFAVLSLNRNV